MLSARHPVIPQNRPPSESTNQRMYLAKTIVGVLVASLSLSSVLATPVAPSTSLRTAGPEGSARERRRAVPRIGAPPSRGELINRLVKSKEALARYRARTEKIASQPGALRVERQQVASEAEALWNFVTSRIIGPPNPGTFRLVNELGSNPASLAHYRDPTLHVGLAEAELRNRERLAQLADDWAAVKAANFPIDDGVSLRDLVSGAPSKYGKPEGGWGALAVVGLVEAGVVGGDILISDITKPKVDPSASATSSKAGTAQPSATSSKTDTAQPSQTLPP